MWYHVIQCAAFISSFELNTFIHFIGDKLTIRRNAQGFVGSSSKTVENCVSSPDTSELWEQT